MLKKVKSMIPVIALIVMVLGVSYISALDEKKTAEMDVSHGQTINELNK